MGRLLERECGGTMVIMVGGESGGVVDATALSFLTVVQNEVECSWTGEPDRRGD